MSDRLEHTNSGVRKKGDIEDIAEFAREVEDLMEDEDVDEESVDEFQKWRPREEDTEDDIRERTVETASIGETKSEEKTNGVKEDIARAGKAAKKAGRKIEQGENPEKEAEKASKRFLRPLNSLSAKMVRNLEKKIYSSMTKFNPYFFDSKEFSADLKKQEDGLYAMNINISDESRRNSLKGNFGE
jgi:hypothetical protein